MWKTSSGQFSWPKLNRAAQTSNACAWLFQIWWLKVFQWYIWCAKQTTFKSKLFTANKEKHWTAWTSLKKLHDFTLYLSIWENGAYINLTEQLQKFTKLWKALLNFGKFSTNTVQGHLLNTEPVPTKELSCILRSSSTTEMCSTLCWETDCH